jgi:hypothetical protein
MADPQTFPMYMQKTDFPTMKRNLDEMASGKPEQLSRQLLLLLPRWQNEWQSEQASKPLPPEDIDAALRPLDGKVLPAARSNMVKIIQDYERFHDSVADLNVPSVMRGLQFVKPPTLNNIVASAQLCLANSTLDVTGIVPTIDVRFIGEKLDGEELKHKIEQLCESHDFVLESETVQFTDGGTCYQVKLMSPRHPKAGQAQRATCLKIFHNGSVHMTGLKRMRRFIATLSFAVTLVNLLEDVSGGQTAAKSEKWRMCIRSVSINTMNVSFTIRDIEIDRVWYLKHVAAKLGPAVSVVFRPSDHQAVRYHCPVVKSSTVTWPLLMVFPTGSVIVLSSSFMCMISAIFEYLESVVDSGAIRRNTDREKRRRTTDGDE